MLKAPLTLAFLAFSLTLAGCAQQLGRQSMALPEPTCRGEAPRLRCEIPKNDPSLYASYFTATAPTLTPIAKTARH